MRTALLVVTLAGCASVLPGAEVRYSGVSSPQAPCGVASPATLVVRRLGFSFAPTSGVLLIPGDVAADGTLTGSLSTVGMDRKPFTMTFGAKIVGAEVSGTYITPRCRFDVALRQR